jgi:xanthine dehydrogenase molybdopterin-binding subunit B
MTIEISRRDFLKASGSLLVTVGATGGMQASFVSEALAQTTSFASPPADALGTWLAVGREGNILAFSGKVDHGQGLRTALTQVIAEELDVSVDRVSLLMGDTVLTPDQGVAQVEGRMVEAGADLVDA